MHGKGTKILALHSNSGSRFYRVIPQLRWMQKQGYQVELAPHNDPDLDGKIEWADLVLLQMVFSADFVADLKAKGKLVIFECDDIMHLSHEKHYSYKEHDTLWKRLKWIWRVWRVLRQCDGVIVSTPELVKAYGWMARKIFVFPNYMELEHWLKEPKKNLSDTVRILWSGSTSHTGDLHWVKPIMAAILKKYPHVKFIYVGHGGVPSDDLYSQFIYGEDIFAGLPMDQRESMLAAPPNVYPYVLASLMADIAIAPLEKNEFNKYKTQCKYLEYALNGIPGVYSKWFYTDVRDLVSITRKWARPYSSWQKDYLEKGPYLTTGLAADTPQEWIDALSLLIEDATLRRQIGENARAEVIEKFSFADHAPRWQGFVESILHGSNHPHPPQAPSSRAQ